MGITTGGFPWWLLFAAAPWEVSCIAFLLPIPDLRSMTYGHGSCAFAEISKNMEDVQEWTLAKTRDRYCTAKERSCQSIRCSVKLLLLQHLAYSEAGFQSSINPIQDHPIGSD